MILTCPACATQYRLKEGAIPPEGRQVRCAACKHKWHEDGVAAPAPAPEPVEEGAIGHWPPEEGGVGVGPPQPDPDQFEETAASVPEAAARDQMIAANPEPDVPGQNEQASHGAEPVNVVAQRSDPNENYPSDDQGFASIPAMHDDNDRDKRGGRMGLIIGLILVVIAAAAAFYYFAPAQMKARAGIAESGESPLEVIVTTRDRQRLASGNELLAISGRVINNTDREQAVPPIHAELRDEASNRLVYQWTIRPPVRSLSPGAAASFNSAEVDVPAGANMLSLRFVS